MRIKRKFYLKFLAVSVLICLMCMTGAWMVRSNLGKIKIKDISILDGNGHKIAATMFIPSTATKETPAPAALMHERARVTYAMSWHGAGMWGLLLIAMDMEIPIITRKIRWMLFSW